MLRRRKGNHGDVGVDVDDDDVANGLRMRDYTD